MTRKATHVFIISTFVTLYLMVSIISTIHVIDFFLMSNPKWLAISLAIAFEVGAAASLASIITLDKMNKGIVWSLFILLTLMQAMGNTYYTYIHLNNFQGWIELFGLVDEELIYQKRVLSVVSGAILPIVALGFIKSLVDYIKPDDADLQKMKAEVEALDKSRIYEDLVKQEQSESFFYDMDTPVEPIKKAEPEPVQETAESVEGQSIVHESTEKISTEPKVDNKNTVKSIDRALAKGGRGISFNDQII